MLRNPITQIFIGVGIAIAVGSSLYFEDIKQTAEKSQIDRSDMAEMYLFDTEIITLNELGEVSQVITTPSTVQHSNSKQTHIINPQVNLYQNDKLTWQVRADNAIVSADNNEMSLRDNVQLFNPENNTQLRTHELIYNTSSQIATSNSKITVLTSDANMTANGLRFKLAEGYYELKNRVTANYAR
jgi:LPS export ABC transporter protein LptC